MNKEKSYLSRVGKRGQITIARPLRKKYGIRSGSAVREFPTKHGILLRPEENPFEVLETLSRRITEKWPKNLSVVEAIRREREKRGSGG
jgi:bifunctional DNA-binding transcriptional regulator/antitoxin component of YhaV-PrlF toxin-antitoxin module